MDDTIKEFAAVLSKLPVGDLQTMGRLVDCLLAAPRAKRDIAVSMLQGITLDATLQGQELMTQIEAVILYLETPEE
jgi:hypothetical protein